MSQTTTKTIHLYDRSRVVQDWKCPRSRYWNYEYGGRGIVSEDLDVNLFLGGILHDSLAAIAIAAKAGNPIDIDKIAVTASDAVYQTLKGDDVEYAREIQALTEGLIRGFRRHVWPRLLGAYPEIVLIEQELTYEHDGFTFMSKPDLVLRGPDGLIYVEYKSTGWNKPEWVSAWDTAVQLHSTCKAIERAIGEPVQSVMVQGLYKGREVYGKLSSPFVYGYRKMGNPSFTKEVIQYEYKPGFNRFPVWEIEGGVKQWVEGMPEEVLVNQYPATAPIFVNDHLVERFFKQRQVRETEIAMVLRMYNKANEADKILLLDGSFPQRFDQCNSGWGSPCVYRQLCFSDVENPLENGYDFRVPHHLPELEQFNAKV